MIKKEKIFELKIQEDDDVSGIDSISLVDEPAIEVNWVSFSKEKDYEFHIPDGEDDAYLEKLISSGKLETELLEEFEIDGIEYINKDNFVITLPNGKSELDDSPYRVRYKYTLNPEAGGNKVIDTTRQFCKELVTKDLVWRIEDMDKVKNQFGQSAIVWRGGYNCRHIWAKITYKKKGYIPNNAAYKPEEGYDILGISQPDTRTKYPSFSKESFEKISLDYDGTLSTTRGQVLAQSLLTHGKDVYIVTGRHKSDSGDVYSVADKLGIPHNKIHFTEGAPKWRTLKSLGINKHYDNNSNVISDINKNAPNVTTEQFDYNVGSIGGYVDPGIGKKKVKCKKCGWEWNMSDGGKDPYVCHKCGYNNAKLLSPPTIFENEFEYLFSEKTHSDYPDSIKNNAKSVLKWVEENGWGSCGTEVGKQRANQLASGEALSMDTIKRMYSYLSRHSVDLDSSTGYGDGCGKLMYDAWGGKSALSWSESKVKQSEKMSKQYFAQDNEKQMVLGPAMIPNQKIFRKDGQGNPYYVYFTPETIKLIAQKYMKNKYTDNNDQMHDGEAVKDVYVVESWIKESENDKSTDYGFSELPVGTWFVSMKINNLDIWNKVKDHQLNGFSVSGFFEEVASFKKEEIFLEKVAEILMNIKE